MNYYDADLGWYLMNRKIRKQQREAKKRELKLEKMRDRASAKALKLAERQAMLRDKKQAKLDNLEKLKDLGFQKGYTPQNPLKRHKRSRDLTLCQKLWEQRKDGKSVLQLAYENNIHPITVMRHIKEYQLYLNLKNKPIDKATEL